MRAVAVWWPSGAPREVERLAGLTSVAQLRDGIRVKLAATVDAVSERSGGSGVAVSTEVVYGHPAQKLIHAAGTDALLVVGSRGLGGVRGTLVGSISLECAQYAQGCAEAARKILEDAIGRAAGAGVACETLHVADAYPAQAIVQAAEAHGAGLVVMASHGRSGLGRVLLGSQTQAVLAHAKVPVLVVRL